MRPRLVQRLGSKSEVTSALKTRDWPLKSGAPLKTRNRPNLHSSTRIELLYVILIVIVSRGKQKYIGRIALYDEGENDNNTSMAIR